MPSTSHRSSTAVARTHHVLQLALDGAQIFVQALQLLQGTLQPIRLLEHGGPRDDAGIDGSLSPVAEIRVGGVGRPHGVAQGERLIQLQPIFRVRNLEVGGEFVQPLNQQLPGGVVDVAAGLHPRQINQEGLILSGLIGGLGMHGPIPHVEVGLDGGRAPKALLVLLEPVRGLRHNDRLLVESLSEVPRSHAQLPFGRQPLKFGRPLLEGGLQMTAPFLRLRPNLADARGLDGHNYRVRRTSGRLQRRQSGQVSCR
mmetsp:Transcript_51767/g.139183  ORF Transcript_51767/g.139183 Transcript_51767/m.139183 type:complete len:256 (-) Transcript_51767:127-894(-)